MNKDFKDLDDVLNSKEFQQKLEKEKSKKSEKKKMSLDDIFDLIAKNYNDEK